MLWVGHHDDDDHDEAQLDQVHENGLGFPVNNARKPPVNTPVL